MLTVNPKMRVLVVDDERFIRNIVVRLLKDMGFNHVEEADDGTAAVALGEAATPGLVICDINMKPMNGLRFLQKVRTGTPGFDLNTPVIMLTGLSDENTVGYALALDANAFLLKPVSRARFGEKLQRVLTSPIKLRPASEYQAVDIPGIDVPGGAAGAGISGLADEKRDAAIVARGMTNEQFQATASVRNLGDEEIQAVTSARSMTDEDFESTASARDMPALRVAAVQVLRAMTEDEFEAAIIARGMSDAEFAKVESVRAMSDEQFGQAGKPSGEGPDSAGAAREMNQDEIGEALNAHLIESGAVRRAFNRIKAGSRLPEGISSSHGTLLVAKGSVLTEDMIERLKDIEVLCRMDNLWVIEPDEV